MNKISYGYPKSYVHSFCIEARTSKGDKLGSSIEMSLHNQYYLLGITLLFTEITPVSFTIMNITKKEHKPLLVNMH